MVPGFSTYDVGEALDWFFTITFPTYTMARALQQIMINGYNKDSCAPYTTDVCDALSAVGNISPCCPGESKDAISDAKGVLAVLKHHTGVALVCSNICYSPDLTGNVTV